ncbi:hypothetical protein EON80_24365 [bacterium]|nr:MAG: hypothetical protein EON80_24365 [bacterium]
MTDKNKSSEGNTEQGEDSNLVHGKNALEWVVFGASLLLVGSVLAFLTSQAISSSALPPRLEISLGQPINAGERVLVPVTVKNLGDITASGVEVEVKRQKTDETSNFSLPYVPREGHRKGWVEFDAPLKKEELKAGILGYEES